MNELFIFLGSAAVISLSGVLQPGALTAATVSAAARRRWAGAWVAVGHGVVELPLMLLVLGCAGWLKRPAVGILIGTVGGGFLLWMAWGSFCNMRNAHKPAERVAGETTRHPLVIGIVMSACNPYFLGWWLTVGLGLANEAGSLGGLAFAAFAAVHWSMDLAWLTVLAWTAHKGGQVWGARVQQVVLAICAVALLLFGVKFLTDAGVGIHSLLAGG